MPQSVSLCGNVLYERGADTVVDDIVPCLRGMDAVRAKEHTEIFHLQKLRAQVNELTAERARQHTR